MRNVCLITVLLSLLATLPFATSSHASTPTADLPDRSLLWRSEEALGRVLPPDVLTGTLRSRDEYGYDVDDYDLELAIDFTAGQINAATTLTVTINEPDRLQLAVDLDDALQVTRTEVDSVERPYQQLSDQVIIDLAAAPPVGTQLMIGVEYHGTPDQIGNKSMRFSSHAGVPMVYTLSTPYSTASSTVIPISHYWRACKDVPDDKSTFSAAITVPDTMLACANGVLVSDMDNGDGTRTFTWEHDYPVAPYLIALGATNYVTIDDTYVGPGGTAAIQHFVYPEDLTDAEESFNITVPAIEFFATVFGEYPFIGEKYSMFETPPGPAVEEQTIVAYPNNLITGAHQYDWILVHELGHMWWGDCVTCASWDHVWLSEGFASYSEALWWEHLNGPSGLRSYMDGMDNGPYAGTIFDPPYVWHAIVYDKGAWVLHMLRRIMGDEDFFQFVLDYRAAHEYGSAVTDDLIAAAEAVHGAQLDWFFEPWLYHQGRPDYDYWWHSEPGPGPGEQTIHLAIEQVQSTSYPTYKLPIDVRVVTTSGQQSFVIWDSLRVQTASLVVTGTPLVVVMDPDSWLLADFHSVTVDVAAEAAPLAPPAFLAQNLPNPFNPSTEIRFGLSREGQVALRIFDVRGRMLRTLVQGTLAAGEHSARWDGNNDRGEAMGSGVYFYRLVGPAGVSQRRMVLLR